MTWMNTLDLPKNVTHMGDIISIAPSSDRIQPSSTHHLPLHPPVGQLRLVYICKTPSPQSDDPFHTGFLILNRRPLTLTSNTKAWSLKCHPQQKLPQLVACAVSFASWDQGKHASMAWILLRRNSQPSWAQPCLLLEILQLVSYPKALIYLQKGWSKMAKQRSKALCQRQLSSNSSMDSLSSTRTPFHYIHENSQVASIHTWNAGSQIVMPYLSQALVFMEKLVT